MFFTVHEVLPDGRKDMCCMITPMLKYPSSIFSEFLIITNYSENWIFFKINKIIPTYASVSYCTFLIQRSELKNHLKDENPVAVICIIRQLIWMSQSDLHIKTNQEHNTSNEAINF